MDNFVSVKIYPNRIEAELAQNALENEGIPAMIATASSKKVRPNFLFHGFNLMVSAENANRARLFLEQGLEATPESEIAWQQTVDAQTQEFRQAEQEFEQMHRAQMESKARSVRSVGISALVLWVLAVVIFFLFRGSYLGSRIALVCALLGIVQIFVWQDALQAREKLKQEQT
jgi:hypothetical protein